VTTDNCLQGAIVVALFFVVCVIDVIGSYGLGERGSILGNRVKSHVWVIGGVMFLQVLMQMSVKIWQ
jgi:hypothetical protein